MKKLALFFTAVFLIGATVSAKTTNTLEAKSSINNFNRGYGNSFIFTEGGIEFSVFPDGQFDFYAPNYGPDVNVSINTPNVSFSLNSGYDYSPYVQYDDFGAIIQIENTPVYYDFYGRVVQVGNVNINYNNYGRVARVGGLYVHYNSYRTFTHYTGYINSYNRYYVYRPWHAYYAVPAPSFCVVYARPYRQHYTPVRHYYYRPYTHNYREPVRYTHTRSSNINGRRGAVATNSRTSDRYRQAAISDRSNSVATRGNSSRDLRANSTRNSSRAIDSRTANTSRSNQTVRSSDNRNSDRFATARGNTGNRAVSSDRNMRESTTRGNQGTRATSSDRNMRESTTRGSQGSRATSANGNQRNSVQRNARPESRPQMQRANSARNTSAVTNNTRNVKSMPKGKPQASNTRISSNKQQQRSTSQRVSSERTSKQPSSRTNSKRRGN